MADNKQLSAVEEAAQSDAERALRREFGATKVQRRVRLNTPVLSQETQAELKDGVLTLRLAKTPDARPTKIRIG